MHVRHLVIAVAVVMVPRPAVAQITKTDLLKLRPDVPVAVADADAR